MQEDIISIIKKTDISQTEIKHIIDFVVAAGGIEYAINKGKEYAMQAINCLDILQHSKEKDTLEAFAHYVIEREK